MGFSGAYQIEADIINSKCDEKDQTPAKVHQYIVESIDTSRVNTTGDFQARFDYLEMGFN